MGYTAPLAALGLRRGLIPAVVAYDCSRGLRFGLGILRLRFLRLGLPLELFVFGITRAVVIVKLILARRDQVGRILGIGFEGYASLTARCGINAHKMSARPGNTIPGLLQSLKVGHGSSCEPVPRDCCEAQPHRTGYPR